MILNPFTGTAADYFSKHKMLIFAQFVSMSVSAAIATFIFIGFMPLEMILVSSVALGMAGAIETPLRQSFYTGIVNDEEIPMAASLNTTLATMALTFGPGLAGLFLATWGAGWAFVASTFSYVGVMTALLMIKITKPFKKNGMSAGKMFKEGWKYTISHRPILFCIFIGGVAIFLGNSNRVLLPGIGLYTFGGAGAYGWLGFFQGFGAMLGAFFISAKAKNKMALQRYVISGMLTTGLSLILFPFARHLIMACFALFISGIGMTLTISSSRAELMSQIDEEKRGRVVGFAIMVFLFGICLGSLMAGFLADLMGSGFVFQAGGSLLLAVAIVVHLLFGRIYRYKSVADVPAS